MNIKKDGVQVYNVVWKIVDSRSFGLAQRRKRLYILGAPRTCKRPMMKSKSSEMRPLGAFLSQGRRRERYPSLLAANDSDQLMAFALRLMIICHIMLIAVDFFLALRFKSNMTTEYSD